MNQATWTALIGVVGTAVAGLLGIWKMNVGKTVTADKDFLQMYNELLASNRTLIKQNAELTAELKEAHSSIQGLTKRIEELEDKMPHEY